MRSGAFRLLSLVAAAFLLVACDSTSDADGMNNANGGANKPITDKSGAQIGTQRLNPGDDLVANVGDRVFFALDSSELTSEARMTLDKQAQWLKARPELSIVMEGHCDERGTREYNLALGERRANAAKNYLLAQGVEANRVQTISYGKERPAVDGQDESAWSQNRRSVTVVQ